MSEQRLVDANELLKYKSDHGRWIIDKYKVTLTCSECGKQYTQFPLINSWQPEWNYCPNCGAYMEEVEE